MSEGVDYAFTTVDERALRAAGKVFAMRYIGPGSAGKHLTAAERDRLWAAGLSIVLLAEGGARDALGGYNLGVQHGEQARNAAAALGAPAAMPVYFAVDFQVTSAQWPIVAQYLHGAAFGIGTPQVGVYGSYSAMVWAARDKVAHWFFQTYAWSSDGHGGYHWFPGNHVEQYHNGIALAGGNVDLCRAMKVNYGAWAPTGVGTMSTPVIIDMVNSKTQSGISLNNFVTTMWARVVTDMADRFDQILAAAHNDSETDASISPAARAQLVADLIAALPTGDGGGDGGGVDPAALAVAVCDEMDARQRSRLMVTTN